MTVDPVRLLEGLLRSVVPKDAAEGLAGDLREDYLRRRARDGRTRAGLWVCREALTLAVAHAPRPPSLRAMAAALQADLRTTRRGLLASRAFSIAAIATLALGTGAATAIFSVAYGVSLRPLPFPEPQRLVRIYESHPADAQPKQDVSIAAFNDWRTGAASVESAALFSKPATRFLADAARTPVTLMSVSPSFFSVLGIAPALGLGFRDETDYTPATADKDVVISFTAWQRLFGGDPAVLGRSIDVTGVGDADRYRVVGVMPESFLFDQPVDGWRPTKLVPQPIGRLLRMWRYDRVVARLRPDATIEQATAELQAVAARAATQYPAISGGWTVTVEPLRAAIIGSFGRATWLLLAAVALVLIVSCLNVGGLLVARSLARDRDIAIRAAIGAGTLRLLTLRAAESAWLAMPGGAAGLLLAWWGVRALKHSAPPGIPRLDSVAVDGASLLVAMLATGAAIVVFTAAPILRRSRGDLAVRLRAAHAAGSGPERSRRHLLLVGAQCAAAATLAVLTLLLARSYAYLTAVDLGWQPSGVVAMNVAPPPPSGVRRPWFWYVQWSDRLVRELEATPGVVRAAITTEIPLSRQVFSAAIARGRGSAAADNERWAGVRHNVTDGYFALMGMRLIAGRTFNDRDRFTPAQANWESRATEGVAVVTRATAARLWPGQPAVGQALWLPDIDNVSWRRVIGVVDDVQFGAVGGAPELHVFVPWTQLSSARLSLLVKGRSDPAALLPIVRNVVRRVEPGTAIDRETALDALVSRATAQPRFVARTVAGFGALALLLAAVGLYGMVSYVVAASTREFGIRLALGAPPRGILSRVVSIGLTPVLAGGAAGVLAAMAIAHAFRSVLFEVQPLDAPSLAAAMFVLLIVGVTAATVPAVRASRIDPIRALRIE
jgi:putative ABC transport system permease protein